MKLNQSKLLFFLLFFCILIFGILSSCILPKKFYFDSRILANDFYNEKGFVGSYPFSISFYYYTGLHVLPYPIIALIQIPILFYFLIKIGIPNRFHILTLKNVIMYLSIFMIGFFINMPSKEFITFVFFSLVLLYFLNHKLNFKTITISILLVLVYGYFFRSYFFIVLFITLLLTVLKNIVLTKASLFIIKSIFIVIILSLCSQVLTQKNFSQHSRAEFNEQRIKNGDKNSNSAIIPPLKTDSWYGEVVSVIYGYISVNFPLTGLKHFKSPQIIAFIVWQILLFMYFYSAFVTALNTRETNNKVVVVFLFVLSYFAVQAVFEPDLGSAVRHKIGLLPLIYYCMYYDQLKFPYKKPNL